MIDDLREKPGMRVPDQVFLTHPYRINFPDGTHTRFTSEVAGAQSARHNHLPMVNEQTTEVFSARKCSEIARAWDDAHRPKFQ